jgi:hypothetical protein
MFCFTLIGHATVQRGSVLCYLFLGGDLSRCVVITVFVSDCRFISKESRERKDGRKKHKSKGRVK